MLKMILKILKKHHKHKWKHIRIDYFRDVLYPEGYDYYYECKCGAVKYKHILEKEETIKENKR